MKEIDIGEKLFPMAGVALLVLLILIAAAPHLMTKSAVKADLPKARVIEADLEDNISITLKSDGSLYLNNTKIEDEDSLIKLVKEIEESDTEMPYYKLVVIRADKEIDWGKVLEIFDRVKKCGCKRVALAVVKRKENE